MLNHFRTLLLNLGYAGDAEEHIPSEFQSLTLSGPLAELYALLFPATASRFFKRFLAQSYISLIHAAGLQDEITSFDPRISYSLDTGDYFKINRFTNPSISSSAHPIFLYGEYATTNATGNYYDSYRIEQISNSTNIRIYSNVREKYVKLDGTYTPDAGSAAIALDFTDPNTSARVPIGNTGVSFAIGGGATFTGSSSKTWEFIVEAPFKFGFDKVYKILQGSLTPARVLDYKPEVDVTKFANLWKQHYNPVYKVAGLLIAYVKKVDSIL